MKKVNIHFIIIIMMVVAFICFMNKGDSSKKDSNYNYTGELRGPIQENDFVFKLPGDIIFKLGDEFLKPLKERLGPPNKVDEYVDDGGHYKLYDYQGFQIRTYVFDNEKICMFTITGHNIKTNRGLMVGDNKDRIEELYGLAKSEEALDDDDIVTEYYLENKATNDFYKYCYIDITWSKSTNKVKDICFVGL